MNLQDGGGGVDDGWGGASQPDAQFERGASKGAFLVRKAFV